MTLDLPLPLGPTTDEKHWASNELCQWEILGVTVRLEGSPGLAVARFDQY
jgi:hypothetical protein